MTVHFKYIVTTPGILKIISLIFNIWAIIFVQSSEYPYYVVRGFIVFDALPIASIVFTAISLLLLIWNDRLQICITWLWIELLILCCLTIVYVYGLVHMVGTTIQCYEDAPPRYGCPRQLLATISGICAVTTYVIDALTRTTVCRKHQQPIDGFCEVEVEPDDDNV